MKKWLSAFVILFSLGLQAFAPKAFADEPPFLVCRGMSDARGSSQPISISVYPNHTAQIQLGWEPDVEVYNYDANHGNFTTLDPASYYSWFNCYGFKLDRDEPYDSSMSAFPGHLMMRLPNWTLRFAEQIDVTCEGQFPGYEYKAEQY